jgi:hypothetical protein
MRCKGFGHAKSECKRAPGPPCELIVIAEDLFTICQASEEAVPGGSTTGALQLPCARLKIEERPARHNLFSLHSRS